MDRGMPVYFPDDTYDTPADSARFLLDRLLLGGRWYLYARHARTVLKARALAVRGKLDDVRWAEVSWEVFRSVEGCGGRVHIRGIDNLRIDDDPVVIVGNHMSTAETQMLPCIIAPLRRVTFVVKRSLVTHPVFGPVMRSRDPIVVTRTDPRRDMETVLREGRDRLAGGMSVIVFPQSTRRVSFDPDQFNTLGVKLARSAGVQAVPLALKTDFWGNGSLLRDFGPVSRGKPLHMAFGRPLPITGNGKVEHHTILGFIHDHLTLWGAASVS